MPHRVLPSLLLCLLVLPHQATAASIPVVITFDQQVYERFDGRTYTSVSEPMPPLVVHAVFSIADNAPGSVDEYAWGFDGRWSGGRFDGVQLPPLPTPADIGPLDKSRAGSDAGGRSFRATGLQIAGASWWRYVDYGDGSVPRWTFAAVFVINANRPVTGDLGPPSLQSMLDTLASGGTATASVGWYYGDWPSEDEETSYVSRYRGTYAVDTTATAVPEPASLFLLASGLALFRRRK